MIWYLISVHAILCKMHTLIFLMTWWPPCKRFSVAKNSSSSLVWQRPYFMYKSVISIFHPVVLAASAERLTSSSMAVTSQLSLQKNDWFLPVRQTWHIEWGWSGFMPIWEPELPYLRFTHLEEPQLLQSHFSPCGRRNPPHLYIWLVRVSLCWLIKKQGPWTTA